MSTTIISPLARSPCAPSACPGQPASGASAPIRHAANSASVSGSAGRLGRRFATRLRAACRAAGVARQPVARRIVDLAIDPGVAPPFERAGDARAPIVMLVSPHVMPIESIVDGGVNSRAPRSRTRPLPSRDDRHAERPEGRSEMSERESMPYDVVIVGAGPAGLSAAIRLKQLAAEKGGEIVGLRARKGLGGRRAHPVGRGDRSQSARRADARLARQGLPAGRGAGHRQPALGADEEEASSRCRTSSRRRSCTTRAPIPAAWAICAAGWRGRRRNWASRSSPASPRPRSCIDDDGAVKGVATGDMGVARDGTHKPDYQPGLELHAKYTFFSRGRARASDEAVDPHASICAQGLRAAGLRPRHQGIVGHRSREPRAGPRDPHAGLAAQRDAGRTAAGSSITRPMGRSRSAS